MPSNGLLDDLQGYVDSIVEKHGIPAVSVAVWHANSLRTAASGVLNVQTGVKATVDSVFQIGSVTKVLTASLILLLVDQGKIDLDKTVKFYLPNFHVADPEATERITVRHLLSHSSGLASDAFSPDEYEEGNAIARYVDRCFLLPQVHKAFGQKFSYSNAGYVIAGRIIEVVSQLPWRKAVEDLIFKPLGMTQAVANPADVVRFRAAIGHFVSGSGKSREVSLAPSCYLPMGMAPTGSVLTMTASDLLKFGRAHLSRGRTLSGEQWMSERSASIMQESRVALPASCLMQETSWGVGWAFTERQGIRAACHGGGTIGQQCWLTIIPELDSAFVVQLNGANAGLGSRTLQRLLVDLLHAVTGLRLETTIASAEPLAPKHLAGKYGATGFKLDITEQEGQVYGRLELENLASVPAQTFSLKPLGGNRFAVYTPTGDQIDDFTFLEPNGEGRPEYLFYGYRLHRRIHS
jgi:CubicO group peptidase (beta-lactamase class C family)